MLPHEYNFNPTYFKMQLFYHPDASENEAFITLSKEESNHIIKVIRKQEGDVIYITNGKGFLFTTEISLASSTKCQVKIMHFLKQKPLNYKLHLAVAPTKMNERFEWFLEKATEIGIHEITPIICNQSERRSVKTERFYKIIESAMKQSLHYYMPILNQPISFAEFITKKHIGQKFIAHCDDESEKKSLKHEIEKSAPVTIMIGPEGDFSETEITEAILNNFVAVSLGHTRLRTETAAVVACHSVAFINEL